MKKNTEIDPKMRIKQKKLSKSLVDMENMRFSTSRQLQAVNEVLALVNEKDNPRVYQRAMSIHTKLTKL